MQNKATTEELQNLVFGEDKEDFLSQLQNKKQIQDGQDKVQNSFFDSDDEESEKSWADTDNQVVAELMDPRITNENVKLKQLSPINKSDISTSRIQYFVKCGTEIVVLLDENNYLKVFYKDGSFKSFLLTSFEKVSVRGQNDKEESKILGLCYLQQNNEVLVVSTFKILSLDLKTLKIQILNITYHYTGRRPRWQKCLDLNDGTFLLLTQDGELCFVNSLSKQIFQTQRLQFKPKNAFLTQFKEPYQKHMIATSDGKLAIQIMELTKDQLDGAYDITQALFNAQAHVSSIGLNNQFLALGHVNGFVSLISLQGIIENLGNTQTIVLKTATTPIVSLFAGNRFLYYCDRTKGRIVDFKDFNVLITEGALKGAQVNVLERHEAERQLTYLWCAGSDGELREFQLDFE